MENVMTIHHPQNTRSIEYLEKTLGTPSAQKILRFLVCWERLPYRDLIVKSGLSESNVYATLRKLQQSGVVTSEVRGIYQLSEDEFIQTYKAAYSVLIKRIISQNLYDISKQIDLVSPEKITDQLLSLRDSYKPFIDRYYSKKFSSLIGALINSV
jgi:DNA-binding transcriptional ArsR family regulator